MNSGFVYIVGVGPGAPDLITLRAVKVLEKAEVIVYGNLVPDELVKMYCKNAREIIKITKKHRKDAIRIVIEKALEGKVVAHLKNGDPAIFSSLMEEIEELRKHNIPFEIIPGVSSVSAALLEVNLSLTSYNLGIRGFSVVNGHDEDPRNVAELARILGMVVVLMPSREKVESALRHLGEDYCVISIKRATLPGREIRVNELPSESDGPTIMYITRRELCEQLCID